MIILGGGLAGLLAAIRLLRSEKKVILVDCSLPEAEGKLGGFARFSGAKFSLPPAGMGLTALAGSTELLHQKINEVIEILGIGNLDMHFSVDRQAAKTVQLGLQTELRSYGSIVLTPTQVDDLIARLTMVIDGGCQIIKGEAKQLTSKGDGWVVAIQEEGREQYVKVAAKSVFYATGRLASDILMDAGAEKYPGKGLDLGFRVEFMQRDSVKNLRSLGPDAKIIRGACRTFCLNSPGEIYYYRYRNLNIPGGIIAHETVKTANVGILVRTEGKESGILRVVENIEQVKDQLSDCQLQIGVPKITSSNALVTLFGQGVANDLQDFVSALSDLKLIDWSLPYRMHIPLIDWYWGTYCGAASHKTSLPGLYALGDSAGHARGLLQAALSGWIASEEYLYDVAN